MNLEKLPAGRFLNQVPSLINKQKTGVYTPENFKIDPKTSWALEKCISRFNYDGVILGSIYLSFRGLSLEVVYLWKIPAHVDNKMLACG